MKKFIFLTGVLLLGSWATAQNFVADTRLVIDPTPQHASNFYNKIT